jgi:hypothetical protein
LAGKPAACEAVDEIFAEISAGKGEGIVTIKSLAGWREADSLEV